MEHQQERSIDMKRIRIATLNVHSWRDSRLQSNISRISETIKNYNIDLIGMQEVNEPDFSSCPDKKLSALSRLAKENDMDRQFASAFASFGNASLLRFPVAYTKKFKLKGDAEIRSLLCSVVETPVGRIGFYCTHLDHLREEDRMEQLKMLFKYLSDDQELRDLPHFIVGDFNSLSSPDDYSSDKWKEIAEVRAKHHIQKPKTDVYQAMINEGYVDVWKAAKGKGDTSTVWAKTRIDYIFASKSCTNKWKTSFTNPVRVDSTMSDHYMIMVDLLLGEQ